MHIPISTNLKSNILLAGAGGGYDFLCSLPIALKLIEDGHNVYIANYSFTFLSKVKNARWLSDEILEISHLSHIEDTEYFPEVHLTRWFKETKNLDVPIYCFPRIGVKPLSRAYNQLIQNFMIDQLFIVDGGVDGIFRGDEYDLGTPSFDSISIIAGSSVNIEMKYYVLTAFGSEGVNKEVSHAEALLRISELVRQNKFYGVSSLLKNNEIGKEFMEAVNYIFEKMPSRHHSNIVSSIISSMNGYFGDTAVNEKTKDFPIWISALTNMFWYFDLEAVAKMKLFYEEALNTNTVEEISRYINDIHCAFGNKHKPNIPI